MPFHQTSLPPIAKQEASRSKRFEFDTRNYQMTCVHTRTDAQTHLRGLKWRGSERSRGGFGSSVRAEPESSSEEPEGLRERPGRVEDEEALAVEEGSRERLSGGL